MKLDKKEYAQKYYADHKNKLKEYAKQYREDNPGKVKITKRQWYENNIEEERRKSRERQKIYREQGKQRTKEDPEKKRLRHKKWIMANPNKKKGYDRKYYKSNTEKIKENSRKYQGANYEKLKAYKKRYRKTHCDEKNLRQKNRSKTDVRFNLNRKMGIAIWDTLKRNKAGRRWEILVGYTCNNLIKHLKKTLPKGYTWQDFLKGKLHIDHKIPISAFNYTKSEHIDFKRCWALSNLQLLPARENMVKHAKLSQPFQPALKI